MATFNDTIHSRFSKSALKFSNEAEVIPSHFRNRQDREQIAKDIYLQMKKIFIGRLRSRLSPSDLQHLINMLAGDIPDDDVFLTHHKLLLEESLKLVESQPADVYRLMELEKRMNSND